MIRIRNSAVTQLMADRNYLSEAALARACGLSKQHLNVILHSPSAFSRITLTTLDKIMRALQPASFDAILEYWPDLDRDGVRIK